jgi:pimeloyl-ACP methyl ester carboxylesterase
MLARFAAPASAAAAGWSLRHLTAPAVRRWRPGKGERARAGPLAVRLFGSGTDAVVLVHGFVASGEVFGSGFDHLGEGRRVAVPDLLGFGRSRRQKSATFSLEAQLDALDEMADAAGLDEGRLRVGGHSLGAVIALHWAARRAEQVDRAVLWGAPLYSSRREGLHRIQQHVGLMERMFALDGRVAHRTCMHSCQQYPAVTGWLAAALNPRLPVALARQEVSHTWESYVAALNDVILSCTWRAPLGVLDAAGVPVVVAHGTRDPVPVEDRSANLAREYRCVATAVQPRADHHLPLTHPAWAASLLVDDNATGTRSPTGDVVG